MPDRMAEQLDAHLAAAAATRDLLPAARTVAELLCTAYERGSIVYAFGNGGSAADAQHPSRELIGRYQRDRRAPRGPPPRTPPPARPPPPHNHPDATRS